MSNAWEDVKDDAKVVNESAAQEADDAVESLRTGFISLHKKDNPQKRQRLMQLIESLDAATLTQVVRAFSNYFSLVNVAEEVKNPLKNMPAAILIALVVSTLMYMAVAVVAIAAGSIEELAASEAPLALIY